MGHIQVHETAATLAHPGWCHGCGYNGLDRKFYVDTGIATEWDGQIIMCEACLLNLIVTVYKINPFDELERYKNEVAFTLKQTEEDREDLRQLKEGLLRLRVPYGAVIRLAAVVEEETDGPGRDQPVVSSDQGAIDFNSVDDEQIEPAGEDSSGESSVSDSGTSVDDSKPDKLVKPKSKLSLS